MQVKQFDANPPLQVAQETEHVKQLLGAAPAK